MIRPRWHLRSSLTLLLVLASAIAFLIALALLLAYYQPRLADQTRYNLSTKSRDLAHRSETVLAILQGQLELLAGGTNGAASKDLQHQIEKLVGQGAFSAVYRIAPSGRVEQAAIARVANKQASELLGNDLGNDRLRRQVMQRLQTTWSDKYLSPVSHRLAVAVGVWTGSDVVIGEIPLSYILEMVSEKSNPSEWAIWVTDGFGDILADSERNERVGVVNLANLPLFVKAQTARNVQDTVLFEDKPYEMAASHSGLMNWYFIVRSPSGLDSPQLRTALNLGLTALLSLILLSLVFAPLWATLTSRPIDAIASRARQVAEGKPGGQWPQSSVIELSQLSSDLEQMSDAIHERERELEIIFESSPVGMLVADKHPSFAFARVNAATLRLFGYQLDEMLGKNGTQLGIWKNPSDRDELIAQLQEKQVAQREAWLRHKNGSEFLAYIQAKAVQMGGSIRTIWVAEDITELRRIEHEIRELNTELEGRVQKRTEELRTSNHELSTTVERLQQAQNELVRAEKLASLGSLVAGVAHELNTPIGNGVMAISTMRNALKTFQEQSAAGLKRSVLDNLLESVDTGSVIAERNLQRAAELVASFKQVAVDQTSSQRRRFELAQTVHEVALTLQPTLKHSVAHLEIHIPEGIEMDGYPGPLGQIIANLISNAAFHAFEGREQGLITVSAELVGNDRLRLSVQDDGCGIPPELLPRIFDPFVTSKMGRGGTGLGLHIAHNIAVQVLGGSISVDCQPGAGCCFELRLPLVAPAARGLV